MEERKKQRLISKGYEVGSITELLDLTPEETDLVKFKLFLSRSLKAHREKKKLSQEQFSKILGSSQSRVARMENCDPLVSIDLLLKTLGKLGISIRQLSARFKKEIKVTKKTGV
jgi:predicted XRE-type DNA-binding protein